MPDFFKSLASGFMPHGYCLRWDGPLLFVFIAGNLGIAIAYFLIPAALRHFVGKRNDLPYPHMFRLFAAFILSCGVTHLLKIWTLYRADYWIEASVDLWTAGVSLVTAALLYPILPKALALRSPKELEEANIKLQNEIEERKKTQKMFEEARDQAIEASNLKSAFLANVSHELRTPLSGVLGMNELLLLSGLSPEQRELSQSVQDSARSLLVLVNDILDLSKIEAGKLDIDTVRLKTREIVSEAMHILQPAANAKGLRMESTIADDVPESVIGDPVRTHQVLLNLMGNALKFTHNGWVRINVDLVSAESALVVLKFSVSDTGIGIGEDERKYLFSPFSQIDNSSTRKYGGTGLGLNISKRLVELMGGEIGFVSEKGKGSTFWFSVPFKMCYVIPDTHQRHEELESTAQAKVLIVEDQLPVQALIEKQMENLGMNFHIVGTAEEALQELETGNYSLILMDCHLPKMNGYDATKIIRQKESESPGKRIPIVAMTAGAMKGDDQKCLDAGMDDYLSKPYTIDQLKDKLAAWLPKS